MGSPMSAAIGSLSAFSLGAIIPLLPFLLFGAGSGSFALSLGASGVTLAAIGLAVSRLTHRSALASGLRQVLLGGAAALVTYAIGTFLGTAVA
jgi:vacuolar iron transporter family protein